MLPFKASAISNFVASLAETRAALSCPSCHKTFSRPVRYLACLHTVCQDHVSVNKFCPVCRADVRHSGVVPDIALAEACEAIVELEALYKDYQPDVIRRNSCAEVLQTERQDEHKEQEGIRRNSLAEDLQSELQEELKAQKVQSKSLNITVRKPVVKIARMAKEVLYRVEDPEKIVLEGKIKCKTSDGIRRNSLEEDIQPERREEQIAQQVRRKASNAARKPMVEIPRMTKEELNRVGNPQKKVSEQKNRLKSSTSVDASESVATPKPERRGRQPTPRAPLEKRNAKGETALHVACRCLKTDRILELLDKGADPNTKDNAGWTPLHEVCQQGSAEAARLLLRRGALPAVPGLHNETPLHEAVRYGHAHVAAELVARGADPRAKNIKGETPWSLADAAMREVLAAGAASAPAPAPPRPVDEFADMHVYCDVHVRTIAQKLQRLARHHDIHIEDEFNSKVSHVIVSTDEDRAAACSAQTLQAVLRGVWLLSSEWVTHSSEECLQSFDAYEVSGVFSPDFHGPKRARLNREKKLPGLFDGCHFYFHNVRAGYEITKSLVLSHALLTRLIVDGGGKVILLNIAEVPISAQVLKREPNPECIPASEATVPYHAAEGGALARCSHYIVFADIFEPMYNMAHIKALPLGWLIECIQKFELCEPW